MPVSSVYQYVMSSVKPTLSTLSAYFVSVNENISTNNYSSLKLLKKN